MNIYTHKYTYIKSFLKILEENTSHIAYTPQVLQFSTSFFNAIKFLQFSPPEQGLKLQNPLQIPVFKNR